MKYLLDHHEIYRGIAYDHIFFNLGNHYSVYPMLFCQDSTLDSNINHTDLGMLDKPLISIYHRIDRRLNVNCILEFVNYHLNIIIILIIFIIAIRLIR